jgi:hypothetical protein
MRRGWGWLVSLSLLSAAAPLVAQSIRGTVVDEGSKLPIASVLVRLIDDAGLELPPGVRSDSLGAFIVHAPRTGTWRVRATRIGFSPVTSEPVSLSVGALAVVRLRMTTVAQQLLPVQIVEQRQMTANELMSTTGFDLRQSRGVGRFLSGDRLAAMGKENAREIFATWFQPTLYVLADSVLGDVLRIRDGLRSCEPEVYLDGRLLATAPERGAIVSGPAPITRMDSIRAQGRLDSERTRVSWDQMNALTLLSSLTAEQLHGIEVYKSNEVPPPSLGGWLGMTKAAVRPCGTVAVWTKAGAMSLVTARHSTERGPVVQVITGTLLDYDTDAPLAGRSVALLSEDRTPTGTTVVTDERGDFTLRTSRAGDLRLQAGGSDYLVSTTGPFPISTNELILVKLFVSSQQGVLAPLGIVARLSPQNVGVSSRAGFTYRRERGLGGSFIRDLDIQRKAPLSFADLMKNVEGIALVDVPVAGSILVVGASGAPACAATYFLDGVPLAPAGAQAIIAAIPLTRIFGVEVYTRESDIPSIFADPGRCGVIAVWTGR